MITEAERAESNRKRIEILRANYGDNEPEVKAWDAAHPQIVEVGMPETDRLTVEEVAAATETVPAAGPTTEGDDTLELAQPVGRLSGRRPTTE